MGLDLELQPNIDEDESIIVEATVSVLVKVKIRTYADDQEWAVKEAAMEAIGSGDCTSIDILWLDEVEDWDD